MSSETSLFNKWQEGQSGFTNFGNFQTMILRAYQYGDLANRRRLEIAFPHWFLDKQNPAEAIRIHSIKIATENL